MAHILQYDLRPHKQVERRMMLDAFQILLAAGFPIRKYKYVGMGSVMFWDFLMFHKLLGIRDLTSVERDSGIAKRIGFNRPFRLVDVQIRTIGSAIARLHAGDRHIVWMDYDDRLSREILEDASQAASRLGMGSVCVITVDVEPPNVCWEGKEKGRNEAWRDYFYSIGRGVWDSSWDASDFVETRLWARNCDLLRRAVESGLAGLRKKFFPIFHFLYKDGDHQMMTIGGMFGGREEKAQLRRSELSEAIYYRGTFGDPYRIQVPRFTRRERFLLDREMPRNGEWQPEEFEVIDSDLVSYSQIYRFLPAYAELLL